jgi:hypothetical protein
MAFARFVFFSASFQKAERCRLIWALACGLLLATALGDWNADRRFSL